MTSEFLKKAFSAADDSYKDFHRYMEKIEDIYADNEHWMEDFDKRNSYLRDNAKTYIWNLCMVYDHDLARFIIQHLKIPRKDLKKMERAMGILGKVRRPPNKPLTWWKKNQHHVELIWRSRLFERIGDDDKHLRFEVGPFTIFNSIGAEGAELEGIQNLLEKTLKILKRSKVPNVKKILYGKIQLVGKITRPNWLAWYQASTDEVSVRTRAKASTTGAMHSTIHELGHRYWQRFISGAAKGRWIAYHKTVSDLPSSYPLPDVGEALSFKVRGFGDEAIVHSIEGDKFFLEGKGNTRFLTAKDIRAALKKLNFPTMYASTNAEEHFCETFALFHLDMLEPYHDSMFREIILGEDPQGVEFQEEDNEPLPEVVTQDDVEHVMNLTEEALKQVLTIGFSEDIQDGRRLYCEYVTENGDPEDPIIFTLDVQIRIGHRGLAIQLVSSPTDNRGQILSTITAKPGDSPKDMAMEILRKVPVLTRNFEVGNQSTLD